MKTISTFGLSPASRLLFGLAFFLAAGSRTFAAAGAAPAAGEWPNWRGPNHNGVTADKNWTAQWPKEGPKQLWKAAVGEGYSSMAESGGRLYTMGHAAGQDTVFCLDSNKNGAEVWKYSYACPSDKSFPGPRGTPAVDGKLVYSLSRKGHLFCFDAAKGTVVWQKNAEKDLGAQPPQWDISGSPLVYGNLLIVNVASGGAALDKTSGQLVWKSAPGPSGYATPVPFEIGNVKGVSIFAAKSLLGVNPANGQVLWKHDWQTSYDVNAADPIFSGDKVFLSSGYGRGGAVLQINQGAVAAVWENKEFSNHTSSCVLVDGCLYGFDGQINGNGPLKCVDFLTGAQKWQQPGMSGTLIAADGKLIMLGTGGKLVVAEASPAGYKELASAQVLGGQCWTAPILSGGKIFARNTKGDLVCMDVSGK